MLQCLSQDMMDGVSSFFPTLVSQIVETVIALAVDMGQQNSPWSPPEVSQLVPPSILSRNFSFNSWGHSLRPAALVCPPFWLLVVFFLWFCGVHQVLTVLRYAVLLFFFREHFFCSHPATLTLGTLPSISSIIASTAHVQPSGFLSSSLAGPLLHQLFVVCPGFSPGSAKIVSQIVSGKLMLI